MRSWNLPYAPHLGIVSPNQGFFCGEVGPAPELQIECAAAQGFRSVFDNALMSRPPAVRRRMGKVLAANQMVLSSFVDHMAEPTALWTSDSSAHTRLLRERLETACEVGAELGARQMTVVSLAADRHENRPRARQMENFASNLAWAAEFASKFGIGLGLEPVSRRRMAGLLVRTVDEGAAILAASGAPSLSLVFDTEHVANESADVVASFGRVSKYVGWIQISGPGRSDVKPDRDHLLLLRKAISAGYLGAVELEYMPSGAGTAASLQNLASLDCALASGHEPLSLPLKPLPE